MPASQLTTLTDAAGNPVQLQHNTADAWLEQVALHPSLTISVLGGYRTRAQDAEAGVPTGGHSHGYGTCVDINMKSDNLWAIANFPSTWVRDLWNPDLPPVDETPRYEFNHWHYIGPLSLSGSTTSIDFGEEMKIAIVNVSGVYTPYLIMPGRFKLLGDVSLAAYRNGEDKNHGPLGVEYDWTLNEFNTATRGFVELSSSSSGPYRSISDDDVAAIVAALSASN